MRESYVEQRVCNIAKKCGYLVYKISSQHHRGLPDRLFIKEGEVFFIEFKSLGKKPSKIQSYVHKQLSDQGIEVYVIDNVEDGQALIARLPEQSDYVYQK